MNHFRKLTYILLLFILGFGAAHGQLREDSRQVLSGMDFDWKFVQSKHFRVHYYTRDAQTADLAIRLAEESLVEIGKQLDYRPRGAYAIHIFLNEEDFIHSNQYKEPDFKEPGETPLTDNSGFVIYPGNTADFKKEVKSEVARLILREFYFSGSIQSSVQRSALLHMPEWYLEGLSAYLGEGWTPEDEAWIAGLHHEDLMEYAVEGNEPINRLVRKSIWYYIGQEYGDDKLAEIFYMTRVTRSVEIAFVKVWGVNLRFLTKEWGVFIKKRIAENHEYRDKRNERLQPVPLDPAYAILGQALHPDSALAAVYLEKNGHHSLQLLNLETGELSPTGIEGGFTTDQYDRFPQNVAMAWHPDGVHLSSVVYQDGVAQLCYLDIRSGDHNLQPIRPVLEDVTFLSYSHDGTKVVASGLAGGTMNLYWFKPGTITFRPLTQSRFDHLYPHFSLDDQTIFFSSNRPGGDFQDSTFNEDSYRRSRFTLDLFKISVNNPEIIPERLTDTPEDNEIYPVPVSSFELNYITDETGLFNLRKLNVFTGEGNMISNLSNGLLSMENNGSIALFTSPDTSGKALFVGIPADFTKDYPTLPETRLKFLQHKAYQRAEEEQRIYEEELARAKAREEAEQAEQAKQDSAKKAEGKPTFYVFDEGKEEPDKPRRKLFRTRRIVRPQAPDLLPNFDTLQVKRPATSKTEWATKYVTTSLGFDPIWRLYLDLGVGFEDIKGNHRLDMKFTPYWNLKTSDLIIDYTYLKPKTDLGVMLQKSSRFLNTDEFLLRYNYYTADFRAVYPLNRFSSLEAGMENTYIQRFDLNPLDEEDISGEDLLTRARIEYQLDRSKKRDAYTYAGFKVDASVSSAFSYMNRQLNFTSFQFDARHYLPVRNHLVFATRLTGGGSFGARPQQFFMGGTKDWLFGNFQNPEELPIAGEISAFRYMEYVSPVRGFLFNGRNGTKYVSANAELRIPLSRSITSSLNSNPIYNVEIIPFYDIGTSWVTGNPLSQRNPITTLTIDQYPLLINVQTLKSPFIMGFGTGVRTNLMGYNVRFDLAWGVEDNTVLRPKLHLSLGKNF